MNAVKNVDAAAFEHEVLRRSFEVPVVVDFWAEWCGPCKVLGPTLERLATEGGGAWELAKIDVDANQQLAMQFQVQGIPTVVAFKDGRPVDRFTGAVPEPQIRQFIERVVPSELDMLAAEGEMLWEQGEDDRAEAAFRTVLATDPSHQIAGLGLAGMLLERDDGPGCLDVLSRLAPTEDVRRLQATARLTASDLESDLPAEPPDAPEARLDYAKAVAANGRYQEAFEVLLDLVALRDEQYSDGARLVMLDLFELLGPEDPLTTTYRRRLASALF